MEDVVVTQRFAKRTINETKNPEIVQEEEKFWHFLDGGEHVWIPFPQGDPMLDWCIQNQIVRSSLQDPDTQLAYRQILKRAGSFVLDFTAKNFPREFKQVQENVNLLPVLEMIAMAIEFAEYAAL